MSRRRQQMGKRSKPARKRKARTHKPSRFETRCTAAVLAILDVGEAWERVVDAIAALRLRVRKGKARYQTTIDLAPARLKHAVELAHAARALAETIELEITDLPQDE